MSNAQTLENVGTANNAAIALERMRNELNDASIYIIAMFRVRNNATLLHNATSSFNEIIMH